MGIVYDAQEPSAGGPVLTRYIRAPAASTRPAPCPTVHGLGDTGQEQGHQAQAGPAWRSPRPVSLPCARGCALWGSRESEAALVSW